MSRMVRPMSPVSDRTQTPNRAISANPHPNVELVLEAVFGVGFRSGERSLPRVLLRPIRTPTPGGFASLAKLAACL